MSLRTVSILIAAGGTIVLAETPSDSSELADPSSTDLSTDFVDIDRAFYNFIYLICACVAFLAIGWRLVLGSVTYLRTLACLNNPTQRYFKTPSESLSNLKKNIIYAPIFRKRHNREFQLSTAINIGTLPTRLQLLFLVSYFGTNITFCVATIQWNQEYGIISKELRHRSGNLAMVNMIPLFVMAARNNPFIAWLNISFDTFNLLHRWFGRIVILEVMIHTMAWMGAQASEVGWSAVENSLRTDIMIVFGLMATVAMLAISIQAVSVVRHAFYETFKYLHIFLVTLSILGTWYHLNLDRLPQIKILISVISIWGIERLSRLARLLYRNLGNGGSRALIESLPGNAVRVTLDLARPWTFKPGQHAYLYMPSIGLWTSHPFSVAWSEEADGPNKKKGSASHREELLALRKTRISFIIRARTGFTNSLFKKAGAAPGGQLYVSCFAEGPYGGFHKMHSYGTVVLFAGGIGISHQVPHVRGLVAGYANGTIATRKIILVWVIKNPEHLEWIRPWMTEILTMEKRRDVLRIMLFISRPRSTKEIHSPSATVQMFPGRPNVETLLDIEIENQVGVMGVSVCAGGSLSDEVRKAVRKHQNRSNIDFTEEAFSW